MKKLLLLFFTAVTTTLSEAQVISYNSGTPFDTSILQQSSVQNEKLFLGFIDSLCSLKYNFDHLVKRNKEKFNIIKPIDFTVKNIRYAKLYYTPVMDTAGINIGGSATFIFVNNHPFLAHGNYGVSDKNGHISDGSVLTKTGIIEPCKHCSPIGKHERTCHFSALEKRENEFLAGIAGKDKVESLCWEYDDLSVIYDVYNYPLYHGYNNTQELGNNHTRLSFMDTLFENHQYKSMFALLHSRSISFNWFVAEALYIYDKQTHFLTREQQQKVESYNGKNGFVKFRQDRILKELYDTEFQNP
jgi:hypothetical protein